MTLQIDVKEIAKKKKVHHPTKRQMNLYFKEDRTTAPATAMLYIIFALVVLLGLSKLLVYDMWTAMHQLEVQAEALVQREQENQQQLSNYDEVQRAYIRAVMTEEEMAQTDRMEILQLVDDVLRSASEIKSVSITGSLVQVTFSGVTLQQAADLVVELEASDLVESVSVKTAASMETTQALTDVSVSFNVKQQGEEVEQP